MGEANCIPTGGQGDAATAHKLGYSQVHSPGRSDSENARLLSSVQHRDCEELVDRTLIIQRLRPDPVQYNQLSNSLQAERSRAAQRWRGFPAALKTDTCGEHMYQQLKVKFPQVPYSGDEQAMPTIEAHVEKRSSLSKSHSASLAPLGTAHQHMPVVLSALAANNNGENTKSRSNPSSPQADRCHSTLPNQCNRQERVPFDADIRTLSGQHAAQVYDSLHVSNPGEDSFVD
eukprot:jgi/Chlat1/8091/Chrsp75S07587